MTPRKSIPTWLNLYSASAMLIVITLLSGYVSALVFCYWHNIPESFATPYLLLQYGFKYSNSTSLHLKMTAIFLAVFLILIAITSIILFPSKITLHGEARFATSVELEKAGLFGNDGIIIGRFKKKYLVIKQSLHVALAAPTRSGKGVGSIIPNLLFWAHSIINTDIKLENFKITSKIRRYIFKNDVYLFDPLAHTGKTHRYNPLHYIERGNRAIMVDNIHTIANILFPKRENTDPIWTDTPKTLFTGIVLLLIETPDKIVSIGQVLRESMVNGDSSDYFKHLIQSRKKAGKPLSVECQNALMSYAGIAAEETRAGIIAGFRAALELWSNPLVDAATSGNDFDFRDFRKKKITLYVGINPKDIARLRVLSSLFWQQFIAVNLAELPEHNPELKYRVLLALDEFAVLGELTTLIDGVAFLAGYGLQLLTVFQSPSQLVKTYKKDAATGFLDNHHAHIIYTTPKNDTEVAQTVSNALGNMTMDHQTESSNKEFWKNGGSINTSQQKRPLMLPQELREMPQDRQLILYRDTNPIRCSKISYFSEPYFTSLLSQQSPTLAKARKRLVFHLKGFSKNDMTLAMQNGELEIKIPTIDFDAYEEQIIKSHNAIQQEINGTDLSNESHNIQQENSILNVKNGMITENIGLSARINPIDLINQHNMPAEFFNQIEQFDFSLDNDPLADLQLEDLAIKLRDAAMKEETYVE